MRVLHCFHSTASTAPSETRSCVRPIFLILPSESLPPAHNGPSPDLTGVIADDVKRGLMGTSSTYRLLSPLHNGPSPDLMDINPTDAKRGLCMFAIGLLGPAGDLRQLLTDILGDEGGIAKVGLGGVNAASLGDMWRAVEYACLNRGLRVSDAALIPWIVTMEILGELGRNAAPVNRLGRLGVVESVAEAVCWLFTVVVVVVVGKGTDAIKACFVDGEVIGVRTSENIVIIRQRSNQCFEFVEKSNRVAGNKRE